MIEFFLCLAIVIYGVLGSYTKNFQMATLKIGCEISEFNSSTGFQDSITPKSQTVRNILFWLMNVVVFVLATISYSWYLGILFVLLSFFVVIRVIDIFMPKPDSRYYLDVIIYNLENRKEKYRKVGDTIRVQATRHILSKLYELY